MVLLQFLGGVLGFLAHICLIFLIIKCGKKKEKDDQSFASWILAGIIDLVVAVATINANGNFYLPLFYFLGSLSIALTLLSKKQSHWEPWDTVVLFLVFICLIIWWNTGDTTAIIAGAVTSVISFIPQIIKTAKTKKTTDWLNWLGYLFFLFADFLSLRGGEDNSAKERGYGYAEGILSIIMLCLFLYNFLYKNKNGKLNADFK